MKSLKKIILLAASVATLSAMTLTASAAEKPSPVDPPSTASNAEQKSIEGATVTIPSVNYDKKSHTAVVSSVKLPDGTVLTANDYDVQVVTKKNSGEYTVTVTAKKGGKYKGSATGTFVIKAKTGKKSATKITGSTKKTAKSAKKKARTVKFTFKSSNKYNKLTVSSVKAKKGKKYKKASKKGWAVKRSKKSVTITVPQGTKKGTYKVKVKIPGYNKYKATTRTFTITVK